MELEGLWTMVKIIRCKLFFFVKNLFLLILFVCYDINVEKVSTSFQIKKKETFCIFYILSKGNEFVHFAIKIGEDMVK